MYILLLKKDLMANGWLVFNSEVFLLCMTIFLEDGGYVVLKERYFGCHTSGFDSLPHLPHGKRKFVMENFRFDLKIFTSTLKNDKGNFSRKTFIVREDLEP